jgi:uncharacterized protein
MTGMANKERPKDRGSTTPRHAPAPTPDSPADRPADRPAVVVVGASARAFAESARRAGWDVFAADLFGDVDLCRAVVAAVRVSGSGPTGYPRGLPCASAGFPPGPCVYTGGLENHPAVIDAIARDRPLAGNAADVVRGVRDPARLAAALARAGFLRPATCADPVGLPVDGSFLVKPLAGAGGRGIARWRGPRRGRAAGPRVWQRFVAGVSWSAAFLAASSGCRLIAVSRQLVGRRWCGGRDFAYCGSIDVPLDRVAAAIRAEFERLGMMLAASCGLVGLVGADVVIDEAGSMHVIEVNPRPTASMELCERATGESLAAAHLQACGFVPPSAPAATPTGGVWSKAVVFAARDGRSVAAPAAALDALAAEWSAADGAAAIADIPSPGQTQTAGGPLVTVFARADTEDRSLAVLRTRVAAVRRVFSAPRSAAEVSRPAAAEWGRRPRPRGNTA